MPTGCDACSDKDAAEEARTATEQLQCDVATQRLQLQDQQRAVQHKEQAARAIQRSCRSHCPAHGGAARADPAAAGALERARTDVRPRVPVSRTTGVVRHHIAQPVLAEPRVGRDAQAVPAVAARACICCPPAITDAQGAGESLDAAQLQASSKNAKSATVQRAQRKLREWNAQLSANKL